MYVACSEHSAACVPKRNLYTANNAHVHCRRALCAAAAAVTYACAHWKHIARTDVRAPFASGAAISAHCNAMAPAQSATIRSRCRLRPINHRPIERARARFVCEVARARRLATSGQRSPACHLRVARGSRHNSRRIDMVSAVASCRVGGACQWRILTQPNAIVVTRKHTHT